MSDMSAAGEAPPPAPAYGMFARNATGLVRGVSPRSSLIINFIPGHPAQSLAAGFFFVFALFPGGNYLVGLLLVIPLGLAMAYAFGLLTADDPKIRRGLHACQPSDSPDGGVDLLVLHDPCRPALKRLLWDRVRHASDSPRDWRGSAWSAAGRRLSSGVHEIQSKHWTIALGGLMMCLSALILAGGWGWTLRIQNTLFWLVTALALISVLIALFTSHSTFVSNFNDFAQSIGGPARSIRAHHQDRTGGGDKHRAQRSASDNTIAVMGFFCTFSIFAYWSTFIGGELRQASTMKTANNMAIAAVAGPLVVAVCAAVFFHTFGTAFMIAANGGGATPVAPQYFSLVAASTGNTHRDLAVRRLHPVLAADLLHLVHSADPHVVRLCVRRASCPRACHQAVAQRLTVHGNHLSG